MIVMSFWMWHKRNDVHSLVKKFSKYPSLLIVMGPIVLIAGLFMVLSHNLWVGDWRVVITILAWLTLLKGLALIFAPEKALSFSKKWSSGAFSFGALVMLVVGVWVAWGAFGA